MIQEFQAFFVVFHQGKQLANSATWKNRTIATNTLIAVLGAAVAIAKGFGYDLHLDDQTLSALGAGVVAVVGVVNSVMHVATSDKVGLPPAAGAGPATDATGPSPGPG
jgi:hypothetical protein